MKTVARIQVSDGGVADVSYGWEAEPEGGGLTMRIEAVACGSDTRLTWEDQFALLDTVWLALVDVRRLAQAHSRVRQRGTRRAASRSDVGSRAV